MAPASEPRPPPPPGPSPRALALWDAVDRQVRETAPSTGVERLDEALRAVLRGLDRAAFVEPGRRADAYEDRALSIGHGQTISQPFLVALMTQLLWPAPAHRVLEVGTGSGYQAAVLARLVAEVVTVECIPELAHRARERLLALGLGNVEVVVGNGRLGWPARAPYDGVIVTAAARRVPPALRAQLRPGGRLVAPIGEPGGAQWLCAGTRGASGGLVLERLLPVAFVPCVGADAPGD